MESTPATEATSATETPEKKQPTTPQKVLVDGQEFEVEQFLKSRKHKTKVDGQDLEVDYDELVRGYGHSKAANARMQEAAKLRKEAEAREKELGDYIRSWKEQPDRAFSLLEQLGVDIDSIAMDRVMKKTQYELMTEAERKAFDNEEKLRRFEAKEAKEAEAKKALELEELREKASTELESQIIKFLESDPKRDADPALVARAVDFMIYALEEGQQIDISEAFAKAQAGFEKERQQIFDRHLKAVLQSGQVPKELADMVRKADLANLRKEPPKRASAEESKAKKEAAGIDDFFNDLGKRYRK